MKDRSGSLILSPGCEPKPFWLQDTCVCVYYVQNEVINYTVILVLVSQDQSLFLGYKSINGSGGIFNIIFAKFFNICFFSI